MLLARNQTLPKLDFLPSLLVYIGKHIFTKCKSAIFNAPKLLFAEIQVQIKLFGGTSVDFVHPENLMMAMLGDEDKTVRAEPVNVIQRIRYAEEGNQDGKRESVQEFHLPRCSFAATSYTDPGLAPGYHDWGRGAEINFGGHGKLLLCEFKRGTRSLFECGSNEKAEGPKKGLQPKYFHKFWLSFQNSCDFPRTLRRRSKAKQKKVFSLNITTNSDCRFKIHAIFHELLSDDKQKKIFSSNISTNSGCCFKILAVFHELLSVYQKQKVFVPKVLRNLVWVLKNYEKTVLAREF